VVFECNVFLLISFFELIYIDIDIGRYWKDLTVVVQMSDSSGWIFTSKQLSESKESDTHRDDELRYKAIWFMRDLSNLLRW
jgi:hypothetical protein